MDISVDWELLLWWVSGLSLLAAIATIIGVPWVVTRLPSDYFTRPERVVWRASSDESLIALIVIVLKNLLGLLLVALGLIMLVTPGQGILTLLIGLLLMNFPGKYRLERWLVSRPGVLHGLNWLRRRQGNAPFDAPRSYSGLN